MNTITDINHNTSMKAKQEIWNVILKWNLLMDNYLKNQNIDTDLFLEILKLKKSDTLIKSDNVTFKYCFNFDFLHMPKNDNNNHLDFDIFFQSLITKNWDVIFQQNINNFKTLRDYLILISYAEHYSKNEIKKISSFYIILYSEEDLNYCNNLIYILNKIYFSFFYQYYISEEYKEIITSFIPMDIN